MPSYQIVDRTDSRQLAKALARHGRFLLPLLELVQQPEMAGASTSRFSTGC